jgi:hypothetical protein
VGKTVVKPDSFGEKSHHLKGNRFPVMLGVKLDHPSFKELEMVAMYEQSVGKSPMVRGWITDKLRDYERNPRYLAFKKKVMAKREEKDEP